MGHVLQTDPDGVDALARLVGDIGAGLSGAAQGAAHAWRRVAAASGSPELQGVATECTTRWGADLTRLCGLAEELGRATAQAAAAYREVEAAVGRSWTVTHGMTGRGGRVLP